MLSRPSGKRVVAGALPAAKACVPCRNWMLSRHGEHAFAASMSMQRDLSLEGRESMAPSSQPWADDLETDRAPHYISGSYDGSHNKARISPNSRRTLSQLKPASPDMYTSPLTV